MSRKNDWGTTEIIRNIEKIVWFIEIGIVYWEEDWDQIISDMCHS